MMTVVDLVARNARFMPDSAAFVEARPVSNAEGASSWRGFNEGMNRIARSSHRKAFGKA